MRCPPCLILPLLISCLCCGLYASAGARAEMVISHRTQETQGDKRENYNIALITLALEKTREQYGPYRLNPIPPMNTPRSLFAAGMDIYPNLLIELSYDPRISQDRTLTYIAFPVDLGLVGYRVCFVNPRVREAVRQVRNLADLRQFSIGQGVGWADTLILRHNGLRVVEVGSYASLFRMVAAGRIDLFCRGINELKNEIEEYSKTAELLLDDHLLLTYTLPRFYYLSASDHQARQRIEQGLRLAHADGSLLQLWRRHYWNNIEQLNLPKRLLLRLENPLIRHLDTGYLRFDIDPLNPPAELQQQPAPAP